MKADIEKIVRGLTSSQRNALRPFNPFSDADGEVLAAQGLLVERDGVWNHTNLGMKAYAEIIAKGL